MSNKPKTIAITLVKFLVPVVIIGYLLWRMPASDWTNLSERSIAYPVLFAALGVAFAAIVLSFVRWWVLVRCQGIPLSLMEALRLSSICFLLSFVSAGSVGGDVFKAVFLARRTPGKRIAAVASVLVDRGAGLYGLLLLVSMGLMIRTSTDPFEFNGVGLDDIKWIVGVLLGTGTAVLVTLVFGGKIVDRVIKQLSQVSIIGPVIEKIGPPLRAFHNHPWAFALSLVMSVGVQGLLVVSMFLIATSMYASPPTLAEHFVIVPIGMLASALPLTPAGIGVLEATVETLYHLVPAENTDASGTLVALVFELVKLVLAIVGTIFYWTAGKDVQESLEYAEEHGEEFESDTLAASSTVTETS
ncbi:lysylphosphatidylglycerol synthase transmembrane domain-containing protein [Aporhodopirellula aestuarii]|uniref:Flippase-like domain-containing protein n=1 Tax=Aporhodopirellula aestuarii TaxID=2950107 RepID=A0ABT0U3W0_9BACT|nr:lysylphosphatidylglycerol synthase transmembrane domain-containing protein [Aporhodopirellula aestuarii]MCM2371230.1 flippase-like domain-containing protein [Aporhodopirellula aestuarii]